MNGCSIIADRWTDIHGCPPKLYCLIQLDVHKMADGNRLTGKPTGSLRWLAIEITVVCGLLRMIVIILNVLFGQDGANESHLSLRGTSKLHCV